MYICALCASLVPQEVRRECQTGTGVTDRYKLPCGSWERNPVPLQEQQVPITATMPSQLYSPAVSLKAELTLTKDARLA